MWEVKVVSREMIQGITESGLPLFKVTARGCRVTYDDAGASIDPGTLMFTAPNGADFPVGARLRVEALKGS